MSRIAIIDDDPDIIESIETVLHANGYETVSAKNFSDGYKIVKATVPDAVLLDVMMEEPDDGFFLAEKLRRENFTKPIILLTSVSKTLGFNYEPGELLPVNKILEKPVSPTKLLATLSEILEGEK
jgi:DNA-binding response OmpR family regulator